MLEKIMYWFEEHLEQLYKIWIASVVLWFIGFVLWVTVFIFACFGALH